MRKQNLFRSQRDGELVRQPAPYAFITVRHGTCYEAVEAYMFRALFRVILVVVVVVAIARSSWAIGGAHPQRSGPAGRAADRHRRKRH